jgi:hypothetical protein
MRNSFYLLLGASALLSSCVYEERTVYRERTAPVVGEERAVYYDRYPDRRYSDRRYYREREYYDDDRYRRTYRPDYREETTVRRETIYVTEDGRQVRRVVTIEPDGRRYYESEGRRIYVNF